MSQATELSKQALYLLPLLFILVVMGFWPSYFASLQSWRLSVHIHNALMFYWMGALIAQALFVKSGWMDWHRRIGRTTFVIAPLMVFGNLLGMPSQAKQLKILLKVFLLFDERCKLKHSLEKL